MSATLNELVIRANELEQKLAESGGELSPEFEAFLEEIGKELSIKADAYKFIMDRFESAAVFFRNQAEQRYQAAKSCENAAKRMKERIKDAMISMKTDEIQGEEIRFKLSNAKPSLVINDSLVPKEYKTPAITEEVDKEAVRIALDAGEKVPGCEYKTSISLRSYVGRKK